MHGDLFEAPRRIGAGSDPAPSVDAEKNSVLRQTREPVPRKKIG
jgi:hypothetical protein